MQKNLDVFNPIRAHWQIWIDSLVNAIAVEDNANLQGSTHENAGVLWKKGLNQEKIALETEATAKAQLKEISEVVKTLHDAAKLYEEAALLIRDALVLIGSFCSPERSKT